MLPVASFWADVTSTSYPDVVSLMESQRLKVTRRFITACKAPVPRGPVPSFPLSPIGFHLSQVKTIVFPVELYCLEMDGCPGLF